MDRTGTVTVVGLLVLLSVAAPALGTPVTADGEGESARWQQTTTVPADANETATAGNETSPGARLGGVVAAQGVAVGTEIESRSLSHQLNRSNSNESKAAVLARQVNQSRSRLDALRAERERLQAAHEEGTISENEYRVRATRLSARISAVRRLNTQTSDAAERLPRETLRRNGVSVTALGSLRSMADEVEGPEIAEIAREVAGPRSGLTGERRGAGERGENRSGGPDDGRDARPGEGRGPPDDSQGRSTGNETTDAGEAGEEPTPRGNAQEGPTNSSADGRGQGNGGENAGNGGENAGNGGENAGNGGENAGDGNEKAGSGGENPGKDGENAGNGSENAGNGNENAGKDSENAGNGGENAGNGGGESGGRAGNG